jgi:hypothetical protein
MTFEKKKKLQRVKRGITMFALRSMLACALRRSTRTNAHLLLALLAGLLFIVFVDLAGAQNLINTGSINNTGLIRVKDQAAGLPSRIDGVFEFFGANQQVPAKQYSHLVLSGSGTKTTAGGSFTVTDSISIASAVTLRVETGSSITLNGTITEAGYLAGMIRKTVNLSGSTSSSDFGNIGTTVSWIGQAPGSTTITRSSDSTLIGNGHQSIRRFYNILPETNSGLNATLVFRYSDNELSGQNPATLSLWRSADSGATWRKQGGIVDVTSGTITKTGISSFALWTAADNDHPLGSSTLEGTPVSIALASGNNATGPISTPINPFVVTVTDGFGSPVQGVNVVFAITNVPSGASGQSLSVTNATTGANGQASTIMTLGNQAGTYIVAATSPGLTGSPVMFTATATGNTAASIAMNSGNNQIAPINSTLPEPLAVIVTDALGNPVQGTTVTFTITSAPAGALGQTLSQERATTGPDGKASTLLTLGNKVGKYTVAATSAGLAGSSVNFSAVANPTSAATIALTSGNNQSGIINSTFPVPFVVTVADSQGNPVPAVGVRFAIVNAPDGTVGGSLSTTNVMTDANGQAASNLTLGSKVGAYTVNATLTVVNGNPVTFSAIALHGVAASLYKIAGDSQVTKVNTALNLPFTVKITDVGENPVPGATLVFSIDSIPSGATGQSLSVTSITTDANGLGSTLLIVGNRVGKYCVTAHVLDSPASPVLFSVTVNGAPPQFVAVRDTILAYRGVRFEHQLRILDPDSASYPPGTRTLCFSKLWGPSWINLDSTSGLLSGTPGPNDIGVSGLILRVADNFGQSSVDTFYVRVSILVNAEQVWSGIPTEFQLLQNYPNPFNPSTEIRFAVPRESKIQLLIFDILGRHVRTLVDETFTPGRYEAVWDSRDDNGMKVGSGVYLYRLTADESSGNAFVMIKKMLLVK